MQKKWLVGAAIALGSFVLPITTAGADPKPGLEITLNCSGETVYVSVAGNGRWTPAHDLNSTLVGVPIAFGAFNGVFTSADGSTQDFTDPPFTKPNPPRSRNQTFECTYTVNGSFPDGASISGHGSVKLMVPSSVRF